MTDGVPVLLGGTTLRALVVGAGAVGARKALALHAAGAHVRVVAPTVVAQLRSAEDARLLLVQRAFVPDDIGDAALVIAATDDRAVNAMVAAAAHDRHRLTMVTDAPDEGTVTGMAVHRSGAIVVAVAAGGVPALAARLRDRLAAIVDARYAAAAAQLGAVRVKLLASGDRSRWRDASSALIDADVCARVEEDSFPGRVSAWEAEHADARPTDAAAAAGAEGQPWA